jgi:ABC-type amino acid transport substrate-binding protein
MSSIDLEQAVRAALTRRLQLSRVPEVPGWDAEAVAAILTAAGNAVIADQIEDAMRAQVCVDLASDGRVLVTSQARPGGVISFQPQAWAGFLAAVKAGEYDEHITDLRQPGADEAGLSERPYDVTLPSGPVVTEKPDLRQDSRQPAEAPARPRRPAARRGAKNASGT